MGSKQQANSKFNAARRGFASISGVSDEGAPSSENRAPCADLRPWVAQLTSVKAAGDPDALTSCGIYSDVIHTSYVFNGHCTAKGADQDGPYANEVVQCGQQSKFMPLSCTGDIMTAGFGLRAGALFALTRRRADTIVDSFERADIFGMLADDFRDVYSGDYSPQQWNLATEEVLRRFIARHDPPPPDPVSVAFELAAFAEPTQSLLNFAESQNVSPRQLQRIVKRDFGLSPRKVMQRARALDLAAQLCGITDEREEEDMKLRYFDQSHMNREFASVFGITPYKFCNQTKPLLIIALEQRQARRREELNRNSIGAAQLWHGNRAA